MLSRTAEYALRATLYLARRQADGPVSAEAVATALGAPANYLSKTMQQLAREGILASVRGPGGGFALAERADTLSIARVVAPFEESHGTGRCLLGDRPCDAAAPCAAHQRWTAIRETATRPLATTTIADLLEDGPTPGPASASAAVPAASGMT